MGGFVAAHTAAEAPDILGGALISPVDLGEAFGSGDAGHAVSVVDDNVGISAGLHILAGTTPSLLAEEARTNAQAWRLAGYASRLADRPLLIMTSDDGFAHGGDALADGVRVLGGGQLARASRHGAQLLRASRATSVELLKWLAAVAPPPSSSEPDRADQDGSAGKDAHGSDRN